MPRIHWATSQIETERNWLDKLRPRLPLAIPEQVALGAPGEEYPYEWAVYRWLEGDDANGSPPGDLVVAAEEIGQFVTALRAIDPTGGREAKTHRLRGTPLAGRDRATRSAIAALDGSYDKELILATWEESLSAPDWDGPPTWFHGDLLPGNVIHRDGRPVAVIDFSGLGVGDPACDLMMAWALFEGESRETFRRVIGAGEAEWLRGRGCALSQAVIFIPYYLETNPGGVAAARRSLEGVLEDAR
jgi:aminoglycoside phosphotransferase (APT) family kinase protein